MAKPTHPNVLSSYHKFVYGGVEHSKRFASSSTTKEGKIRYKGSMHPCLCGSGKKYRDCCKLNKVVKQKLTRSEEISAIDSFLADKE